MLHVLLAGMLLAAPILSASAQVPPPEPNDVMLAGGFLDGHPDLRHRQSGLEAYARQDYGRALEQFRLAARFGDKPSQAVVAEMHWDGIGTAQDRSLGLAWMDLAAERGYDMFVIKRDLYWNAATPAERQQAIQRSMALQADYADAVAEPRLARALRAARAQMTGSRVGSLASPVQVIVPGYGTVDGTKFYDPRHWDPVLYRQARDAVWKTLRPGRVSIGEPEKVDVGTDQPAAGHPADTGRPG